MPTGGLAKGVACGGDTAGTMPAAPVPLPGQVGEPKCNGWRALVSVDVGWVVQHSRRGTSPVASFPEIESGSTGRRRGHRRTAGVPAGHRWSPGRVRAPSRLRAREEPCLAQLRTTCTLRPVLWRSPLSGSCSAPAGASPTAVQTCGRGDVTQGRRAAGARARGACTRPAGYGRQTCDGRSSQGQRPDSRRRSVLRPWPR